MKSLDNTFVTGGAGKLLPFTGVFFSAVGITVSFSTHLVGVLGGLIWMTGMVVSFMSAGASNPAISYALSNAAPVVAIL